MVVEEQHEQAVCEREFEGVAGADISFSVTSGEAFFLVGVVCLLHFQV